MEVLVNNKIRIIGICFSTIIILDSERSEIYVTYRLLSMCNHEGGFW